MATTLSDILFACGDGTLPKVLGRPNRAFPNLAIGQVTTIKYTDKHRGIAVRFPGMEYDLFFHDSNDEDARSRYIYELTIVDKNNDSEQAVKITEVVCSKCKCKWIGPNGQIGGKLTCSCGNEIMLKTT